MCVFMASKNVFMKYLSEKCSFGMPILCYFFNIGKRKKKKENEDIYSRHKNN